MTVTTQLNRFLKKSLKSIAKDLAELKELRASNLSIAERAIVNKMAAGLTRTRDDVIYQCCLTGEFTQAQIAEALGLTAPRISQIYTARLTKLIDEDLPTMPAPVKRKETSTRVARLQ